MSTSVVIKTEHGFNSTATVKFGKIDSKCHNIVMCCLLGPR